MLRVLVLALALSIAGSVEAATYRLFFEVENGTYRDRVTNTVSFLSVSGHVDFDMSVTGSFDFGGFSRTELGGATGSVPAPLGAMPFSLPLGSAPSLASSGSSTFFELHSFETFNPRSWMGQFGIKQALRLLSETRNGSLRHYSKCVSPFSTDIRRSAYPSRKLWDKSVRGKGNLSVQPICATEPRTAIRPLMDFTRERPDLRIDGRPIPSGLTPSGACVSI